MTINWVNVTEAQLETHGQITVTFTLTLLYVYLSILVSGLSLQSQQSSNPVLIAFISQKQPIDYLILPGLLK